MAIIRLKIKYVPFSVLNVCQRNGQYRFYIVRHASAAWKPSVKKCCMAFCTFSIKLWIRIYVESLKQNEKKKQTKKCNESDFRRLL